MAVSAIDMRASVVSGDGSSSLPWTHTEEAALTQQTDLSTVAHERLYQEIVARGGGADLAAALSARAVPKIGGQTVQQQDTDGTIDCEMLSGILFPLLPPGPPLAASVSEEHPAARAASVGSIADSEIPRAFMCPITCDIFEDPVFTADGMTYEREAIATWLADNRTSPLTNARLPHTNLVPNFSRARLIKQWKASRV